MKTGELLKTVTVFLVLLVKAICPHTYKLEHLMA